MSNRTSDTDIFLKVPEITSDDLFRRDIARMMDGYSDIRLLRTAVELNVFSYFAETATSERFSSDRGTDPLLTDLMCRSLADMGFLIRENGGFRNSPAADLYLNPVSDRYQEYGIRGVFSRADKWDRLTDSVRNGSEYIPRDQMFGERWIRAIGESSMGGGVARVMKKIGESVDLSGCRTLLDLGGGHGFYSIGFALKYPGLKISLFDLPMMCTIARENFDEHNIDAETIAGDFYRDDLGGPYDVVFSSFNFSVCDTRLCPAVFKAVRSGGLLILRRHLKRTSEDSKSNLEWCFSTWDGKGQKNYGGSWLPTSEQYLDDMCSIGMSLMLREDMDESSEIVILRKQPSQ